MPPRQRVTISDVAAAAGVSNTTVSHVLNGKGRVEESTRRRVLDTATRLRYRPNAMARSTRSGVSHLLGLVVPAGRPADAWTATVTELFAPVTLAATRTAAAHGVSIVLVPADLAYPDVGHLVCDGVVDLDPRPGDPLLQALRAWEIPTVVAGTPPPEFDDGWWVAVDPDRWSDVLLEHLRGAGARSVLVAGAVTSRTGIGALERSMGAWAEARGIALSRVGVLDGDGSAAPGTSERLRDALLAPDRPDAVVAIGHGTDALVAGVARELGLRLPQDLLIASALDSEPTRRSSPAITAVAAPIPELVSAAVELLLARIAGDEAPDAPRRVPVELLPRASTAR